MARSPVRRRVAGGKRLGTPLIDDVPRRVPVWDLGRDPRLPSAGCRPSGSRTGIGWVGVTRGLPSGARCRLVVQDGSARSSLGSTPRPGPSRSDAGRLEHLSMLLAATPPGNAGAGPCTPARGCRGSARAPDRRPQSAFVIACSGQPSSFAPITATWRVNRCAGSSGSNPVSDLTRSSR